MPNQKFKSENYANMMGINQKLSQYLTGENEAIDLFNFDFSVPGAWTKRWGSTDLVSSGVIGRITGLYEFQQLNGASKLIATANTNAYFISGGAFTSFRSGLLNGALFDFVTFVDRLFAFNGADSFVYDNTTATSFSLPAGVNLGATIVGPGSATGFSGVFQYAYGYLNARGFFGAAEVGVTINPAGASAIRLYGLTTPSGYGITALVFYRTSPGGSDLFRIGFAVPGATLFDDVNLSLSAFSIPEVIAFTLKPRFGELYNNQLFVSGISSMLSTVWFSEVAEPEGFLPESFIEVRTNDGDRVTAMKTYLGQLIIFKQKSFHALSGDNSTNFLLREVSDQYGCLSNRAVVVWEDQCWFLDRKGIAEYNGANVKIISEKIEPLFNLMNVDAAIDNATAIHFKQRNEVWFSIPVSGATMNNVTVVYDYVSRAWTKFDGFSPSSLTIAQSSLPQQTGFYGGYSGTVAWFGASLFGDSGRGVTCLAKTRYHHEMGESVTKQFRRLFLNVAPITGVTAPLTVNFYKDYNSATFVYTKMMYFNPFQSIINFGIPGKSLQMEFLSSSATLAIKIFGYTVEYRYQRNT